jgi:hypothetical protein
MAVLELKLSANYIKKLRKYLRQLSNGGLARAHMAATKTFAEHVAQAVRRGYQQASYPLTPGTKQAYAHGKDAGFSLPRNIWGGMSLRRSGELARSVVVTKKRQGYTVEIDPKRVYRNGDPTDAKRGLRLRRIAAQMETPKPITIRVTPAMIRYLKLIDPSTRKGTGGAKRTYTDNARTGKTIVIHQTAKPVWEPTYRKLRTILPKYTQQMNRYLKAKSTSRMKQMEIKK